MVQPRISTSSPSRAHREGHQRGHRNGQTHYEHDEANPQKVRFAQLDLQPASMAPTRDTGEAIDYNVLGLVHEYCYLFGRSIVCPGRVGRARADSTRSAPEPFAPSPRPAPFVRQNCLAEARLRARSFWLIRAFQRWGCLSCFALATAKTKLFQTSASPGCRQRPIVTDSMRALNARACFHVFTHSLRRERSGADAARYG